MGQPIEARRARRTFFTPAGVEFDPDTGRAVPPAANRPRTLQGSGERVNLSKNPAERVDKRPVQTWQVEAWRYFDAVGEVHYAFELVGQVVGRVRLYVAVVDDPDQAPVAADDYVKALTKDAEKVPAETSQVLDDAKRILRDLLEEAQGGPGSLMRRFAINLSVPGEGYLVRHDGKWLVCSSDELVQTGDSLKIKRDRTSKKSEVALPPNAFVARVWRSHPRVAQEPDSSMLGVLDQCEMLVLLEQAVRVQTRSRLNAGVVFIPDGLVPVTGGDESVEAIITRAATTAAQDESAAVTVSPLVLTGPAELGKELKRIELGRPVDQITLDLIQRTLDRVLTGIDVPKDIIAGLAEVRYSNAVVIDDNLYKSHIEPLCLLIADALTEVLLRPSLRALETARALSSRGPASLPARATSVRQNGNGRVVALSRQQKKLQPVQPTAETLAEVFAERTPFEDLINRIVIWIDPSEVVVRPDRSQAANEGYDRMVISGAAWRSTRGFSEGDEPSEDELLRRLALERTPVPPDMASTLIESVDPEYFEKQRASGQSESGMPSDISQLLEGGVPGPAGPVTPGPPAAPEQAAPVPGEQPTPTASETSTSQSQGGPITPGGSMPPRQMAAPAPSQR